MPKLPSLVVLFSIQIVFECGISFAELSVESFFIGQRFEVERLPGRENDCLFGEVAVRGIIQTVCDPVNSCLWYLVGGSDLL